MPKLYIKPEYSGVDKGDGGIRRVVEAQRRYLPEYDFRFVDDAKEADLIAVHAGLWVSAPPTQPVVSHCHGLYWAEYKWDQWSYALNKEVIWALRLADKVTAPSEWVAQILRRGMWLDPTVLYHGIDPEDFQLSKDHEHAGYVLWNKTRIDPICDVEPLNKLAAMSPDVPFVSTLGDSSIANLHITGKTSYADAKKLVENAAVYLCTSRETFGIGTLEAMACGVPILGWAWGGQREFIRHKETGWLAEPGDYEGLVEGLQFCLAHRDSLGEAAREDCLTRFTWQEVMPRYAQLYDELLDSHQAQSSNPVKVSVIVTCYNLGRFLQEALESVVAQSLPKEQWEVVLIDDRSTDDSYEVAQRLRKQYKAQGHNIRLLQPDNNLGLPRALNFGISKAKGKYILSLDADNMLGDRNTLQVLSGALDADRDLDITYGRVQFLTEDGKPDQTIRVHGAGISGWPPKEFNAQQQLSHRNQIPSSAMYRRRVWERTGGFRERCSTADDADFWCRSTRLGFKPGHVTDAITLKYRNRADSMSVTTRDWAWERWYPESRIRKLAPMATLNEAEPQVPSFEPVAVSVVIPVGPGHELTVKDAVDSLVAQDFLNWECIVVNDTGADLPWIHPFVQVINVAAKPAAGVNPKGTNRVAACRNMGARRASGSNLLFLDADDYLRPDALGLMVQAQQIAKGGYVYSDWADPRDGRVREVPNWDPDMNVKGLAHPISALIPREAFRDVRGFDESVQGYEDWDLFLALNVAGFCGTRVPQALLMYRLSENGRHKTLSRTRGSQEEILNKYKGKVDNMACRSCGRGGGLQRLLMSQQAGATDGGTPSGFTRLLYTGGNSTFMYRGKVTGTLYRFGTDEGHREKPVRNEDVEALMSRTGEFQKVEELVTA